MFDRFAIEQEKIIANFNQRKPKKLSLNYAYVTIASLSLAIFTFVGSLGFAFGKSEPDILNSKKMSFSKDDGIEFLESQEANLSTSDFEEMLGEVISSPVMLKTNLSTSLNNLERKVEQIVDEDAASLAVEADSLAVEGDSLAVEGDSLAVEADSSAKEQVTVDELIIPTSGESVSRAENGLLEFKAYNYYTKPADVSLETLISILGITQSQYDTLAKIILCESFADANGYKEVFATTTTFLNRISCSRWVRSHGTNIYNQAIAPNQFVVYQSGSYLKYDYRGIDYKTVNGYSGIEDAIYTYIVNPNFRAHDFASFRSNNSYSYSNNLFTTGGNRYGGMVAEYEFVYPSFLYSDAAVALRNQALGISLEDSEVEESYVVDDTSRDYVADDGIYEVEQFGEGLNEEEYQNGSSGYVAVVSISEIPMSLKRTRK